MARQSGFATWPPRFNPRGPHPLCWRPIPVPLRHHPPWRSFDLRHRPLTQPTRCINRQVPQQASEPGDRSVAGKVDCARCVEYFFKRDPSMRSKRCVAGSPAFHPRPRVTAGATAQCRPARAKRWRRWQRTRRHEDPAWIQQSPPDIASARYGTDAFSLGRHDPCGAQNVARAHAHRAREWRCRRLTPIRGPSTASAAVYPLAMRLADGYPRRCQPACARITWVGTSTPAQRRCTVRAQMPMPAGHAPWPRCARVRSVAAPSASRFGNTGVAGLGPDWRGSGGPKGEHAHIGSTCTRPASPRARLAQRRWRQHKPLATQE